LPLNQSSIGLRGGEAKARRADAQHFQHLAPLSIKTDSAVTSASVSFFFFMASSVMRFLSMTETARMANMSRKIAD
jgi:hypothetical protein